MMVPRLFTQNRLAHTQQGLDLNEKDNLRPRSRSTLSLKTPESPYKPVSDPVEIPSRSEERVATTSQHTRSASSSHVPRTVPTPSSGSQHAPRSKESVQNILASTTIPIRRKRKPQRLPPCDYVADFSKLLRDDVQSSAEGSLAGSWVNPQFEGLFGNLDGLVEGQMIVGSEDADTGFLSVRSLSTESMPSLSSPDDSSTADMSSISPATVRSPSDQRSRHVASSEDCSNEHPLLPLDDVDTDYDFSGISTPDFMLSPSSKPNRKSMTPEKRPSSFKSSLTASLKALKQAAQTMSNLASTPPLIQPDEFLTRSIFDFQPSLTDDRRPPPLQEPPSAAMRRYLNPRTLVAPDSPAQLHFWVEEKSLPSSRVEAKPKLKIKRKYQNQATASSTTTTDKAQSKVPRTNPDKLPSLIPLATCIPSSIRTPHASSPPTWLEPDGTPSNRFRAAQTLVLDQGWGQPRPREPRENRDFLRIFVCEMNMRKSGKLSDEAMGHARLWLPPVDEGERDPEANKDKNSEAKREKKTAQDRWSVWSIDDL